MHTHTHTLTHMHFYCNLTHTYWHKHTATLSCVCAHIKDFKAAGNKILHAKVVGRQARRTRRIRNATLANCRIYVIAIACAAAFMTSPGN